MLQNLYLLLHTLLMCTFIGSQVLYLGVIHPALASGHSYLDQLFHMQAMFKRYAPVLLLVLCLMAVSGGLMITDLKSSMGLDYYAQFGTRLMMKLGGFFLMFFITCYQALVIGFWVRYHDPLEQGQNILSTIARARRHMFATSILNLILAVMTALYALGRIGV